MSDVLRIENLSAGYGDTEIIHEVTMNIPEGKIVTVVGPNGAGKSTLIKSLYGLAKPMGGSAFFHSSDGEVELTKIKIHQLAARGIGYVPQIDNIFPTLTVDDNLDMGNVIPHLGDRRAEMYEKYPDLKSRHKDRAGSLSGGQRQMLAMARVLMADPKLLLLDEPSAGLAPALVDQLFDDLVAINKSGVSILMVEQNARRALEISDYGYVLDMGRNRHEGPGRELTEDPTVVGIYFGRRGPKSSA